MNYNDKLKSEYGSFNEVVSGASPRPFKPTPTSDDYLNGYLTRAFAKKVNENIVMEVKPEESGGYNRALYKTVLVNWKITGPKNSVVVNGVLQNVGVTESNTLEVRKILLENNIDLSRTLNNPLEYWRGR
jgi:hypothetical protein